MIHPLDLNKGNFKLEDNTSPMEQTPMQKFINYFILKSAPFRSIIQRIKSWWHDINNPAEDATNKLFDLADAPEVNFASDKNLDDSWKYYFEFVLTCTAYSVNLYNVGSFPFETLHGGGGSIIIPYIILVLLVAVPLVTVDIILAQFSSFSAISCFNFCPIFRGLGISFLLTACLFECLFSTITAWGFHQLFFSFNALWYKCDNSWNINKTCISTVYSDPPYHFQSDSMLSVEQEFRYHVIKVGPHQGTMSVSLTVLAFYSSIWVVIFLIQIKGLQSSTKVLYITGVLPYCILLMVLMYGWSLPGAMDGLRYLFVPDWSNLINFKTWYLALKQVLFSFGLARGSYQTFASRNHFHIDVFKTILIITCCNIISNILSSAAVMQILGHLKYILKVDMNRLDPGFNLIFHIYPQGFAKIQSSSGRNFMCFLSFLMISCLGINSMSLQFATIIKTVQKETGLFSTDFRRLMLSLAACITFFLMGGIFITSFGYVLRIVLEGILSDTVIFLCLLEILIVGWFYGFTKIRRNVFMMMHLEISRLWLVLWSFVTPLLLLMNLCWSFSQEGARIYQYISAISHMMHSKTRIYIAMTINLVIISPILLYMIYKIYEVIKNDFHLANMKENLLSLFYEPREWGPRMKSHWTISSHYRKKLELSSKKSVVEKQSFPAITIDTDYVETF